MNVKVLMAMRKIASDLQYGAPYDVRVKRQLDRDAREARKKEEHRKRLEAKRLEQERLRQAHEAKLREERDAAAADGKNMKGKVIAPPVPQQPAEPTVQQP